MLYKQAKSAINRIKVHTNCMSKALEPRENNIAICVTINKMCSTPML